MDKMDVVPPKRAACHNEHTPWSQDEISEGIADCRHRGRVFAIWPKNKIINGVLILTIGPFMIMTSLLSYSFLHFSLTLLASEYTIVST